MSQNGSKLRSKAADCTGPHRARAAMSGLRADRAPAARSDRAQCEPMRLGLATSEFTLGDESCEGRLPPGLQARRVAQEHQRRQRNWQYKTDHGAADEDDCR